VAVFKGELYFPQTKSFLLPVVAFPIPLPRE